MATPTGALQRWSMDFVHDQLAGGRAFAHRITLDVTRPDEPTDNGHIESFNARLRDECLNVQLMAA